MKDDKNLISNNETNNVINSSLESEVKKKFLSYALSVIISRALPNVDDGLKPVHRRILYAMNQLKLFQNKPYKKAARVVGEVIGKYHPHGDAAVYQAMTKMIQEFSINEPLIQGHGNFGSIDGDAPAAMRYTEVRLAKIIQEDLNELAFDTVDFVPNYDTSETEPKVLPGSVPLILLNGSKGIAVGMATSIPPHNSGEVLQTIIEYIKNPEITTREIVESGLMNGPDFPTGAFLVNTKEQIIKILETGRGSYKIRAKYNIEKDGNKAHIVFTEIPYHINKLRLIEAIINLVKNKKIEYISDLKDESNRLGIRLIVTVKNDKYVDLVLNKLFKMTPLQTSFPVNFLAIHDQKPELMTLNDVLKYYVDHQIIVIVRKTNFLLAQDQKRIEILLGLAKALAKIDEVITIIKKSKNSAEAAPKLISFLDITETQVKAILEMRLATLTSFQQTKIFDEINDLKVRIEGFEKLLASPEQQKKELINKVNELYKKYAKPRFTTILSSDRFENISDESLILKKRVLICLTKQNYVKRVDLALFKNQKRGGIGVRGITLNNKDKIIQVIEANSHDNLLFFSDNGKVFQIKAWKIPDLGRIAKGTPIQNLISIDPYKEKVKTILAGSNASSASYLVFVTKNGIIKKTKQEHFDNINRNGKIAINLKDNDDVFSVARLSESCEIIISKSDNRIVRFNTDEIPTLNRTAKGVIGTRMNDPKTTVTGASLSRLGASILSVTSNGLGKRTPLNVYRKTKRGAKGVFGVKNKVRKQSTKIIGSAAVEPNDLLIIARSSGKFIISGLEHTRIFKTRLSGGVKLVDLDDGETITAISVFSNVSEND